MSDQSYTLDTQDMAEVWTETDEQAAQNALETMIRQLEARYGFSSEELLRRAALGDLADTYDFQLWIHLLHIR